MHEQIKEHDNVSLLKSCDPHWYTSRFVEAIIYIGLHPNNNSTTA